MCELVSQDNSYTTKISGPVNSDKQRHHKMNTIPCLVHRPVEMFSGEGRGGEGRGGVAVWEDGMQTGPNASIAQEKLPS